MYRALNKKSVCVNSFNSRNNAMRQRVIRKNTPFECEITGEVNGVNDLIATGWGNLQKIH